MKKKININSKNKTKLCRKCQKWLPWKKFSHYATYFSVANKAICEDCKHEIKHANKLYNHDKNIRESLSIVYGDEIFC